MKGEAGESIRQISAPAPHCDLIMTGKATKEVAGDLELANLHPGHACALDPLFPSLPSVSSWFLPSDPSNTEAIGKKSPGLILSGENSSRG